MPVEIYRTTAPIGIHTTTEVHEHRSLGDKAKDALHDLKDVVTGESNISHKDVAKAQKKEMEMKDKEERCQMKVDKQAAKVAHLESKRQEQQARKCREHGTTIFLL